MQSLLLTAILSSTDPVVLRDMVRDQRIPRSVRQALRTEVGTNDIVVLPIILVLIAVARSDVGGASDWLLFFVQLFLLGTFAGFAAGGLGAWVVEKVDERFSIAREYQALYGVGLVLVAYVVGDAVGGDGFLAAFAAGISITVLNRELCSCFLEYGEVSAEMAMLLSFILFGAVLSALVGWVALVHTLGFAAVVILVARPVSCGLVLRRARISRTARAFLAWFGPRGLNSLLFALLVVRDGVRDAERLVALVGVVVMVSVVVHGSSASPLSALYARRVRNETLEEEWEPSAEELFRRSEDEVARVSPRELADMLGTPPGRVVLDVHSRSEYDKDEEQVPGSFRVTGDEVTTWAEGQDKKQLIVLYCT